MGFPCDEILRNHSKDMSGRFYTLWAKSGLSGKERASSTHQFGQIASIIIILSSIGAGGPLPI